VNPEEWLASLPTAAVLLLLARELRDVSRIMGRIEGVLWTLAQPPDRGTDVRSDRRGFPGEA
jgi:hypothetical protein